MQQSPFSGAYEHMQQLRESISVSEQNIQRYQTSSDNSQSSSFTVSDDMYHKELAFIANQRDNTGFKIGVVKAKNMIDNGGKDYENYHQAFQSKHLPQQKMLAPSFDYAKAVSEHIPSNTDYKKDYAAVSEISNSVMETSRPVTPDAKEMVERQHHSAPNKISLAEQKVLKNGEEAQKQVDKKETSSRHWYSAGRDKVTDKNFTE